MGDRRDLIRALLLFLALFGMLAAPLYAQEQVIGTERVAWDQQAASPTELAALTYQVYVDGSTTGVALTGVQCATTAGAAGYLCSAAWPSTTPGRHEIRIGSFRMINGQPVRSLELSNALAFDLILAPATPQNLRRLTGGSGDDDAAEEEPSV